ncbi:hypothetical protein LZ32DRAFT_617621 [Colletotrichum eremochloae]|nr:hypothetical protein LZ32DRAFT_617621 [Colletotrichum eremochloae]
MKFITFFCIVVLTSNVAAFPPSPALQLTSITSRDINDKNIPPDDNDIEPVEWIEGYGMIPKVKEGHIMSYDYIKSEYPGLEDGWYYGMLCYEGDLPDSELGYLDLLIKKKTKGCTHVALVVGKYNITRQTFTAKIFDVVIQPAEDGSGNEWFLRSPWFEPQTEGIQNLKIAKVF